MKTGSVCLLIFCLSTVSCRYEFPGPFDDYSAGTANFERYINLGGSLSSGFMDGALYSAGQEHSFAALLAGQLALAGGDSFNQAGISSENGYNLYEPGTLPNGRLICRFTSPDQKEPVVTLTLGDPVSAYEGDRHVLNDFSVPAMRIFETDDPSLSANPYYARFASNPGQSTLLGDALARDPTFFTLIPGFEDILNYAASGGGGDATPPANPALVGMYDLTPVELFESHFNNLVAALMMNPSTKGVIANLPSPSNIPFFYHYPYNFLKLSNSKLTQAVIHYNPFNDAVSLNNVKPDASIRPFVVFDDNGLGIQSPQNIVVVDNSLGDASYPNGDPLEKIRNILSGELVLYTLPYALSPTGLGWLNPVGEKYYLSMQEMYNIRIRVQAFNTIIEEAVSAYPGRLALVDLNAFYEKYSRPSIIDGFGIPASYDVFLFEGVPVEFNMGLNGVFSLDGLFPNQRGQALIANEFIRVINASFQANLPQIDINKYIGNKYEIDFK